jgi:anti-sigma factor RsiW
MQRLDCDSSRPLIDAAVDGELDLLGQMAFDAHLTACAACADAYAARLALVRQLRDGAERFAAPESLRTRLLAALPEDIPTPAKRSPLRWLTGGAWAGSLAALAASLALVLTSPGSQDQLGRDLVAAHVRSLMPEHLTDVLSSDKHTVKPWFNGRLPLSPPVPNLVGDGFPLVGGRLDYVDEHTAAALVYRRNQHIINLFVWAMPDTTDRAMHVAERNGYNLLEWTQGGISYAAVSDLNRGELETFQRLWSLRAQQGEPTPAPSGPPP